MSWQDNPAAADIAHHVVTAPTQCLWAHLARSFRQVLQARQRGRVNTEHHGHAEVRCDTCTLQLPAALSADVLTSAWPSLCPRSHTGRHGLM